jgi:hypothetical protein
LKNSRNVNSHLSSFETVSKPKKRIVRGKVCGGNLQGQEEVMVAGRRSQLGKEESPEKLPRWDCLE